MQPDPTILTIFGDFAHIAQCLSAIVVLGITAWAAVDTKIVIVIYSLVIAVVTVAIYIPGLILAHVYYRNRWVLFSVLLVDLVFSYLWITSFILLVHEFHRVDCAEFSRRGASVCSRKYTAEAFSFLAFFFALACAILEMFGLYFTKPEATRVDYHKERDGPIVSGGGGQYPEIRNGAGQHPEIHNGTGVA